MKLDPDLIQTALDAERYPPILTPDQVADLFQVSRATVYRWSSEDRFPGVVRRRRPLRFWRDGLIEQFFRGNQTGKGWRQPQRRR